MTDRLKEWLKEPHPAAHCVAREDAALAALRAVVELHQSNGIDREYGPGDAVKVTQWCSSCRGVAWPCPTIRAIEKEVLR